MFLFLPLCAVFYPVAVLPSWLQCVAWTLPPTYVFEGMRALVFEHVFRADLMLAGSRHQRRAVSPAPATVSPLFLERAARRAACSGGE